MTADDYGDLSKIGLTQLAEHELYGEPYQFDLVGVWRHTNGDLYLGWDSGCSCPSPWECHTDLGSFERITPELWESAVKRIREAPQDGTWFIEFVEKEMKGARKP